MSKDCTKQLDDVQHKLAKPSKPQELKDEAENLEKCAQLIKSMRE